MATGTGSLVEDRVEIRERNTAERIVRAVREVAAIVALVLVSVLMILSLAVIGAVADRLGKADTSTVDVPAPADTACIGEEC